MDSSGELWGGVCEWLERVEVDVDVRDGGWCIRTTANGIHDERAWL